MRWPHESAITRRDEQLARTRRLTIWVASGATVTSFGLAAALGFALPGHTASPGAGTSTHAGSGRNGTAGSGSQSQRSAHRKLSPPHRAPASSNAPPVVSSGGS